MSRYIDADMLEQVVSNLNSHHNAGITRVEYKRISGVMWEFPTADVAEVVRCKDCRYVLKEDEYSYWCNGFTSPMRLVTPKTFCSHGRRKND